MVHKCDEKHGLRLSPSFTFFLMWNSPDLVHPILTMLLGFYVGAKFSLAVF